MKTILMKTILMKTILMKTTAVTVSFAFSPQWSGPLDCSTLKARVVWASARLHHDLIFGFVGESRVLLVLKGGNLIFVILGVKVDILVNSHSGFHKFGNGFSLGGGCNLVHVVQGDRVLIMLSHNLADVPWQGCPEELHLEELHHIVDGIVLKQPLGSQTLLRELYIKVQ
jgi:hypothetical protein